MPDTCRKKKKAPRSKNKSIDALKQGTITGCINIIVTPINKGKGRVERSTITPPEELRANIKSKMEVKRRSESKSVVNTEQIKDYEFKYWT